MTVKFTFIFHHLRKNFIAIYFYIKAKKKVFLIDIKYID